MHPNLCSATTCIGMMTRWIFNCSAFCWIPPHTGSCPPMCKRVRTRCRSPPHKWLLRGCSSPSMELAKHLKALRVLGACGVFLAGEKPTCLNPARHCRDARVGASRFWVHTMAAWSEETRRAPLRDASVCGHTAMAMRKMSTPPPPTGSANKTSYGNNGNNATAARAREEVALDLSKA